MLHGNGLGWNFRSNDDTEFHPIENCPLCTNRKQLTKFKRVARKTFHSSLMTSPIGLTHDLVNVLTARNRNFVGELKKNQERKFDAIIPLKQEQPCEHVNTCQGGGSYLVTCLSSCLTFYTLSFPPLFGLRVFWVLALSKDFFLVDVFLKHM